MSHVVTGATGFLGQVLVRTLLERGESVVVLVRGDPVTARQRACELFPDLRRKYGERFAVLAGDVTLPGLGIQDLPFGELAEGKFTLWHLAANLSFKKSDKEPVMRTNVYGTRNVVQFANRYAARVYFVSTAYVCGNSNVVFGDDDLDVGQRFHNWYEYSKFVAEKVAREECKVDSVIFRPSIIIGEASQHKASVCTFGYYRFAFMFYYLKRRIQKSLLSGPAPVRWVLRLMQTSYDSRTDVLRAPWLVLPYPRGSAVDLVHIDDVVNAMVAAHQVRVPSGTTLHLTQRTRPSFRYLLQSFLSDAGFLDVRCVGIPPSVFRSVLRVLRRVLVPYRHYLASILKYLPYINQDRRFSAFESSGRPALVPGPLTRGRLKLLNRHAVKTVFSQIDWEMYAKQDGDAEPFLERMPQPPPLPQLERHNPGT